MLMSYLNKIAQLSRQDRNRLCQATVFLPIIHWGLILLGYARLRAGLEKLIPRKHEHYFLSELEMLQSARDIARVISIAAQHGIYRATCLRRSLLLWGFLRREGIDGDICFGVRRVNDRLEAHAWVEVWGSVIGDSSEIRSVFRALEDALPATNQGL